MRSWCCCLTHWICCKIWILGAGSLGHSPDIVLRDSGECPEQLTRTDSHKQPFRIMSGEYPDFSVCQKEAGQIWDRVRDSLNTQTHLYFFYHFFGISIHRELDVDTLFFHGNISKQVLNNLKWTWAKKQEWTSLLWFKCHSNFWSCWRKQGEFA